MSTTVATGRAALLRQATATQHRETETRSFVTRLMGGDLDLTAYTAYLAQYAHVYRALESRAHAPDDPPFVTHQALPRFATIVSDLERLDVSNWEVEHPALPATTAYTQRLHEVADELPRYIAHHYTRYLGDLSGGQAIAKRVASLYGATPDQLSFYRFDGIRPGPFKVSYREGLDALDFDDEDDAALVAEAQEAFRLNAVLFDDLDRATAAT